MPSPPLIDAPPEKLRRLHDLQHAVRAYPSRYMDDPTGWVEHRLGEHFWSKEREIAEAVRDVRHVAVHSCFESGKSYTASRLVAWWLDSHAAYDAFVVTTATTGAQVRAILWREIGRAHRKGNLPGRTNQTEWWIGEEMVGFGRKPADYDPEAFQGIHAKYVLVIIDEAAGVPKTIFDAAEGLIANEYSRILAIGNPSDPLSHFANICKPGSGWQTIHIDAFDTPNFTGEPIPAEVSPLLISPTFATERAKDWGENSPLYIAKVRGLFPEDADDGVVRASKVLHCRRQRDDEQPDTPVELGVDVGAGGDFTSIRERRGRKAGRVWRDHSKDSEQVVGKIMAAIRESGASRVKVDAIGIGWAVVGHLRQLGADGEHQAQIVPVNVGESSTKKERFALLRDQIWWEVGRDLSEQDAWDLSALDDDTVAQLLAPKYGLDAHGRVKVEPKDETRKRLDRSPDDADALLLAFYVGAMPGQAVSSADREIGPERGYGDREW